MNVLLQSSETKHDILFDFDEKLEDNLIDGAVFFENQHYGICCINLQVQLLKF